MYMKGKDKDGHLVGIHIPSYVRVELWKYRKHGAKDVGFRRISSTEPLGWKFYADDEEVFEIHYRGETFDENFFRTENVIADAVQKAGEEEL